MERSAGERDRDLVRGGVPTMGGVVVPFIVSLSTTTVALLGSVLGLGLELERPSDIFFPLSRPFGRSWLPAKRLDTAETADVPCVL